MLRVAQGMHGKVIVHHIDADANQHRHNCDWQDKAQIGFVWMTNRPVFWGIIRAHVDRLVVADLKIGDSVGVGVGYRSRRVVTHFKIGNFRMNKQEEFLHEQKNPS